MKPSLIALFLFSACLGNAQTTLRQLGAQRVLLVGAAAQADENGQPNRLLEKDYAANLAAQYSMLEPENAMKFDAIHPAQTTYNFSPGDKLVAFAQANQMRVRGHNLVWHNQLPGWVTSLAATASPATMSSILHDHIASVVGHYKGQVFAWDVVNEPINDPTTGVAPDLRDSVWYNKPGIGLSGSGYIEQSLRWAHEADPNALLFINDYSIEGPGAKFTALYNMVKDFVQRGVPISGVGFEMHVDNGGFPSTAGLVQNVQQIAALGLQVHITEMDVRLKVDSSGNASAADIQAQAQTYQRILGVCLQSASCTAFQTWGFTDKYSWIPGAFPGLGAALPFDTKYQPKPAFSAITDTMQTVPPVLNAAAVVNAASYKGGAVAPGEIVTIFQANDGPAALLGAQFDANHLLTANLAGTQVTFDGVPAPFIYALAGQSSVVVPFEVAGKQQTVVQYIYNGVKSNTVTIPVVQTVPAIFSADSSGFGPGAILNQDFSVNSASNPAAPNSVVQVFATGAGTIVGGATDGALAPGIGAQTLPVTATIGGRAAMVTYAGPAPNLVNGVLQVNLLVPVGLPSGPQAIQVSVNNVPSQQGLTVALR